MSDSNKEISPMLEESPLPPITAKNKIEVIVYKKITQLSCKGPTCGCGSFE